MPTIDYIRTALKNKGVELTPDPTIPLRWNAMYRGVALVFSCNRGEKAVSVMGATRADLVNAQKEYRETFTGLMKVADDLANAVDERRERLAAQTPAPTETAPQSPAPKAANQTAANNVFLKQVKALMNEPIYKATRNCLNQEGEPAARAAFIRDHFAHLSGPRLDRLNDYLNGLLDVDTYMFGDTMEDTDEAIMKNESAETVAPETAPAPQYLYNMVAETTGDTVALSLDAPTAQAAEVAFFAHERLYKMSGQTAARVHRVIIKTFLVTPTGPRFTGEVLQKEQWLNRFKQATKARVDAWEELEYALSSFARNPGTENTEWLNKAAAEYRAIFDDDVQRHAEATAAPVTA